jgi:hypothetical protein
VFPLDARYKTLVKSDRSKVGIVCSNLARGMDLYPFFTVLCCLCMKRPCDGKVSYPMNPTIVS